MPLSYISVEFGGLQLSGWAWLLCLAVVLVAVLTKRIDPKAIRYLTPYLLFLVIGLASLLYADDFGRGLMTLGQVSVPALAYLVAFRAPPNGRFRALMMRVVLIAYAAVGFSLIFVGLPDDDAAVIGAASDTAASVSVRTVALSLIALFLVVNALARSRWTVVAAGLAGLAFNLSTGSRVAAAVLFVMIFGSHRVFTSWRSRGAGLLIMAALLPAVLSLEVVQDRFFFGESEGTVGDLVSVAENVNTSGRRDLWPELMDSCVDSALFGHGLGASYELSLAASDGVIAHPHNDYIRTFCDTGVAGSFAAWLFIGAAAVRGWARLRRGRPGREDPLVRSAFLAALACALLATTENVLVYPTQFMLPAFLMLGWGDSWGGASEVAPHEGAGTRERLPLPTEDAGLSPPGPGTVG